MRKTTIVAGILAVAALFGLWGLAWAEEPYRQGDGVFRALYLYQDDTGIPGTEACHGFGPLEDTRHHGIGLGYGLFLADDVSFELSGRVPLGDAGADTVSLQAGLNYYFLPGHLFVPLSVSYRGDLDSPAVGAGVGLDFPVAQNVVLQAEAGPQYLVDSDIDDRWTWSVGGSIGWQFAAPCPKGSGCHRHRGHHRSRR